MRGEPFVFSDIGGGVNREAAPYGLDDSQNRDALNVQSIPQGGVQKRNGFATLASPTRTVKSLFAFSTAAFTGLVGFADDAVATDLYKIDTAGNVTSIKAALALTIGTRWESVQAPVSGAQGPLYAINGVDQGIHWTGAGNAAAWTVTGSLALPKGRYIEYHDNRVFIAGTDTYAGLTDPVAQASLYWSRIADPRYWDTPDGGRTIFDPEDGQRITAMGKAGPYLLVFKPRKTFVVTDSDSGAYRRLSDTIGCVASDTVIETDIGTMFLSRDQGVMVTDGESIRQISVPIKALLDSIPGAAIANATAVYHNYRYYLSFTTSTLNDTIVEYDTRMNAWWVHKIYLTPTVTTGVNSWAILNPSTSATLYAAGASTATPKVFEAFRANTFRDRAGEGVNEAAYLYQLISQWNVFSQPHIRKILREVRVDAIGEYSLYIARAFNTTYDTTEALVWEQADSDLAGGTFGGSGTFGGAGIFGGGGPTETERRFYTPAEPARAYSLKFEGQDMQDFKLHAYTMAMDTRTD